MAGSPQGQRVPCAPVTCLCTLVSGCMRGGNNRTEPTHKLYIRYIIIVYIYNCIYIYVYRNLEKNGFANYWKVTVFAAYHDSKSTLCQCGSWLRGSAESLKTGIDTSSDAGSVVRQTDFREQDRAGYRSIQYSCTVAIGGVQATAWTCGFMHESSYWLIAQLFDMFVQGEWCCIESFAGCCDVTPPLGWSGRYIVWHVFTKTRHVWQCLWKGHVGQIA